MNPHSPPGTRSDDDVGRVRLLHATTFLVIRHAQSEANAGGYFGSQSDSKLTARGEAQAAVLGEALADVDVTAIYSSDLSRAHDTVAPLARHRGLPIVQTALLRERGMGDLTGMSFERVKQEFPALYAQMLARDPDATPPGGESQHDLAARVHAFLDGLVARHRGGTVVIATHGGTAHHLVRQLAGLHEIEMPFWISVANASVSRVDVTEPVPGAYAARVTYVNRVVPLPGEAILP